MCAVLDEFKDPELGRSVVKLGQVRELHVADGRVAVTLGLTTFSAPLWEDACTRFGQPSADQAAAIVGG